MDAVAGVDFAGAEVVGVEYDTIIELGSPEHYYHYFWGYLLPAAARIINLGVENRIFVFRSCGPVMDPITLEVAELLGARAIVAPDPPPAFDQTLRVPRWDCWMFRDAIIATNKGHDKLHFWQDGLRSFRKKQYEFLMSETFYTSFRRKILRVRNALLPQMLEQATNAPRRTGDAILIKRSERPHFYSPEGPSQASSYGVSRRALGGLDEAARILRAAGHPVRIYECGGNSLADQARTFNACRKLALIRGAEVSNMLWMKPGATVHVVTPEPMTKFPAPHDALSKLMGLNLRQVVSETRYPTLDASDVLRTWNKDHAPALTAQAG